MRILVYLHERATRSQPRGQEDTWCDKFARHLIHAESADKYQNEATGGNIVRKITDMMVLLKQGTPYTVKGL